MAFEKRRFADYGVLQDDVELGGAGEAWQFHEQEVRKGFVRKVFGILTAQLLLTAGIAALFITVHPIMRMIQANPWTLFLAMGITFVSIISMVCVPNLARNYPTNYLLLFVFTTAEAYLIGTICALSNTGIVIQAALITTAVCGALTLYAMQTKYDFTMLGGLLFSVLVAMLVSGIVMAFVPHGRIVSIVYSGIGAALFSCYLVVDIQLMMGSKTVSIGPDDYVFAALNLYLDVVQIFLYILQILNQANRN